MDRGKAASRASALENDARPDVDRVAETKPAIDQRSTEAQTEVDEPATPPGEHREGEQTAAEGGAVDSAAKAQAAGMGEDGGAGSAAQRAASLAEAAFGEVGGSAEPPSVPEVAQPAAIEAVDASGESIAPDAAANDDLADLTDQAQEMREHGAHLRGQAAEARNNAAILRGNLAVVRGGIAEADDGIGTAQVHSRERRSILGQAHQALAVSEQKAAEVAAKAPEFAAKADDGKSESGPMVGEARQTAAENAAKTPEDPKAAGKSREQGAKMDKVAADSATMDDAISQTKERAGTLEQEAAQAEERNAQTRERIGQGTQQLDQMDQHLARQKQETSRARGAAAAAAGHPAAIAARAGQLDERAEEIVNASVEMEQRIATARENHQAGLASVPPLRPAEEPAPGGPPVQREVEAGYEGREDVDVTGEVPSWLTGVDPTSAEQREQAREAEAGRRGDEVAQIRKWARGPFEDLSATDKMGIALRLTALNYGRAISKIRWPGWAGLGKAMLDPRSSLAGVVSGLGMMLTGGANLANLRAWKQDPLGNLLKSSADIATGLTVILGSITLLSGLIAATMAALILLSFGTAAPVLGPILAFATKVAVIVGGWTIAVGKVALVLQALVLIKNLVEAATADTAQQLQQESDQIRSDIGNAGQVVMQIVGAKGAQAGARNLQSNIGRFDRRVSRAGRIGGARLQARAIARGARRHARAAVALPGQVATGTRNLVKRAAAGARRAATAPGRATRALRERLRGRGRSPTAQEPPTPTGRPSQGAGTEKGIRHSHRASDGHEIKVTESGRIMRCSSCDDLLLKLEDEFEDVLSYRPEYEIRLRVIREQARDPAQAAAAAAAADDLASDVVRTAEILEDMGRRLPEPGSPISTTTRRRTSRQSPEAALAADLERQGLPRPDAHEAHHIVPKRSMVGTVVDGVPSSERARQVLRREGISINEADNGVWLPRTSEGVVTEALSRHATIHTKRYYDELARRLEAAEALGTVRGELSVIQRLIAEGKFPH